MKVAVVYGMEGVRSQYALWKLEKDLLEAERILTVRRKAVEEQERKLERLRNELRNRKEVS
jgi:hypothetical protein